MNLTTIGYLQGRFEDNLNGPKTNTFDIKRAALYMRAMVSDKVGATVFVANNPGTGNVEFQHAYVNYDSGVVEGRLGLSPVPFGYENPVTSCRLVTLERSEVSRALFGPYALDRGAFAFYAPKTGFNYSLSVVNGTAYTTQTDPNNKKNLAGRVGYAIPGGEVGASIYEGTAPSAAAGAAANATANMQRYGLDLITVRGPYTVVSELIDGRGDIVKGVSSTDALGGYLTVAYRIPGTASQPYVRYDAFNPTVHTPGNYFQRATLGYSYFLNPTSKLSAEYQLMKGNMYNKPNIPNAFGLQYQVIFMP